MSSPKSPDSRAPETIDGETGTVDPAPQYQGTLGKDGRRIDLSTLRDVRIEMAKVYRMMDAGEFTHSDGTKRVYVLDAIGKIITVAEIERRLDDLEARQGATGATPLLPAATH